MPVRIRTPSLRNVRSIPLFPFYSDRESSKKKLHPSESRSKLSLKREGRGRKEHSTQRDGS